MKKKYNTDAERKCNYAMGMLNDNLETMTRLVQWIRPQQLETLPCPK